MTRSIAEIHTMTYGYIRVSTREQNEDRQLIALSDFDIPRKNLFMDKQSGKDFNRPSYQQLLKKLKPGDLLIIKSIDQRNAIMKRSWNSGASSPRRNGPTSVCWICPCWTPASTGT